MILRLLGAILSFVISSFIHGMTDQPEMKGNDRLPQADEVQLRQDKTRQLYYYILHILQ